MPCHIITDNQKPFSDKPIAQQLSRWGIDTEGPTKVAKYPIRTCLLSKIISEELAVAALTGYLIEKMNKPIK
ncbi:hypothetical protein SAMN05421766_103535 [Zobellia uliginosa]|uniref:Integrase catalytic domain-containing protein n=1 Tax=Zobellia uliginosa TaxID=143224 RepID=A0ABY1KS90_9FLAO|nr:hypothetical protein SAMN05421766_103535 [Zobellia uliginosa]